MLRKIGKEEKNCWKEKWVEKKAINPIPG